MCIRIEKKLLINCNKNQWVFDKEVTSGYIKSPYKQNITTQGTKNSKRDMQISNKIP